MKNSDVKILYVETNEIRLLDIPRALDELGYDVYKASFGIKAQEYEQKSCRKIIAAIDKFHIHCAVSYDFIEVIAQACFETGIPYIAWVYDSPQKELYTYRAQYPCNYIFAFDRAQMHYLKEIGISQVIHMPLAIHKNKIHVELQEVPKDYQSEITFIGQLYKTSYNDVLLNAIDSGIAKQLQHNIDACFMKWGKDVKFHGQMSKECAEYLGALEEHIALKKYPYVKETFYYEAALLSRMVANRERVYVLNKLAEKYDVNFYTNDTDTSQLSEKVKVHPGVGYDELAPIYRNSKININITLHCIETGASQRIFDVMAAGGFLLSNYQEELEEMFIPGEEIVLYHDEQELEELVEYYLTHDEERERIARNGQQRVLREHGYHEKLERAIRYVDEAEKDREVSYIALQRNLLREEANALLKQKTEQAYQQIYELYTNKVYETTIQKSTDIGLMREMIECWQREREIGNPCLFDDVNNLQEAEQKYLEVKHALWRMEQNLSYEKCIAGLEGLKKRSLTKFFVAWVVYANLHDKVGTYLKLSQLMAESSLIDAVEVLTYALLLMPKTADLLLQKADYLMELNAWGEALKTLQMIENPNEEITMLIGELSEALAEATQ